MGDTGKNVSRLEKRVTPGKMGHIWKRRSHLKKWVTFGKSKSHLKKWVTLAKVGHTSKKNGSHLEKWVTLEKMGHIWKSRSH